MPSERKFVFAPDMRKLGDRVQAAKQAAEDAERLFQGIEDANDVTERLVYLATAVRDFKRGIVDDHALQTAATVALTDLELSDEAAEAVRELL